MINFVTRQDCLSEISAIFLAFFSLIFWSTRVKIKTVKSQKMAFVLQGLGLLTLRWGQNAHTVKIICPICLSGLGRYIYIFFYWVLIFVYAIRANTIYRKTINLYLHQNSRINWFNFYKCTGMHACTSIM